MVNNSTFSQVYLCFSMPKGLANLENICASVCKSLRDSKMVHFKLKAQKYEGPLDERKTGSWSYSCGAVVYCLEKCLFRTECSSWKNKRAVIQPTAGNAL